MRRRARALWLAALGATATLGACRGILGIDDPILVEADAADDGPPLSDGGVEARADAADAGAPQTCDHGARFTTGLRVWDGEPRVYGARFTTDETIAYFSTYDPSKDGGFEIVAAARAPDGGLGTFLNPQGAINTSGDEYWPTLTADGQRMFYESPEGPGLSSRIWVAERDPASATFKNPQVHAYFSTIPTTVTIGSPYLSKTGQLVFSSTRRDVDDAGARPDGGVDALDLWLASVGAGFVVTAERQLDELTTDGAETFPVLSSDGEEVFFSRAAPAATNDEARIFTARRGDGGRYGPAERLALPWDDDDAGGAGVAVGDWSSWISDDHCHLYVVRFSAPGGQLRGELWMAARPQN